MLIEPLLSEEALVADIDAADPGDGVLLWWLGQSGFLIKHRVGHILLDPYLSDSLTKKYRNTDKPHVRMTRLAVSPSLLREIRLVTSSHNHTDHLDAETLLPLFDANPGIQLLIPEANREFVCQRLSVPIDWPIGLSDEESTEVCGIQIHAVPAAHNEIDRDVDGRCHYLGYVLKVGQYTIYHSGDTLRYPEMEDLLKPLAIDIALLPINGNRTERRVAGNLWGDEAAWLAKDCGAKLVIPCHYEMFEFNTETPELFTTTCDRIGQPFAVLQCGQTFYFPNNSTIRKLA